MPSAYDDICSVLAVVQGEKIVLCVPLSNNVLAALNAMWGNSVRQPPLSLSLSVPLTLSVSFERCSVHIVL